MNSAFPTKKATASARAKKLIQEVVCRHGIPETIDSDRGNHFTGQIMKEILTAFNIEQCLHTPYNPAASGKIEKYKQSYYT